MNFDTREGQREQMRGFDERRDLRDDELRQELRDERTLPARERTPAATADVAPDDLQRPVDARARPTEAPAGREPQEALSSLFTPEMTRDFRANWDAVQISFVDDPEQAVRKADELVRQVLDDLGRTFSAERAAFGEEGADEAERTERLRMALRRYRAFLQRLLSL